MKISVTLEDGTKHVGYATDVVRKALEEEIRQSEATAADAEIADEYYVDYAATCNRSFHIFKEDFDSFDVVSAKVDLDYQKPAKVTRAAAKKYFAAYYDALNYANEFFASEASKVFSMQNVQTTADDDLFAELGAPIKNNILPVAFYFDPDEIDTEDVVLGQFFVMGKQACIKFLLQETTLTEVLKTAIRHEICHYTLWLAGLPYDDTDEEFYALATAFDAHPYQLRGTKRSKNYEEFEKFLEEVYRPAGDISYKQSVLGEAVKGLHSCKTVASYRKLLRESAETIETLSSMANIANRKTKR